MTSQRTTLQASTEPLSARYDCAMLDLDGVVYLGDRVIDGVPDLLGRARDAGMTLAFVTNNAARPPEAVAAKLRGLGVPAATTDVVTSAQAAARELADRLEPGSRVLVVGGEGLEVALRERGLQPVDAMADRPVAVVQGFHPDVGWRQLAQAAYVLHTGVPWVASNGDLTVPTAEGIAPGNGSLVNAVSAAVGRDPDVVAGKPFRPLFDETVRRIGSERPIVVGDRLDTDIEGANRCGADSLLVMTGVTDLKAACQAGPMRRPTYVDWTLAGLLGPHAVPSREAGRARLAGWTVSVDDGRVDVEERGSDRADGLRTVLVAGWDWIDSSGGSSAEELDVTSAVDALQAARPADRRVPD